jgi:long-chain acyl-CoA synthetase
MTLPLTTSIEVRGDPGDAGKRILSREALAFVAELQREFNPIRTELLAARAERQARIAAGESPDFLAETRSIREGRTWRVAPPPRDLLDRRVEITGAVDRKSVIEALTSGAQMFVADFEGAGAPIWRGCVEGQANLLDAVDGTMSLEDDVATLFVRPRGWHLNEHHLVVDGEPAAASLVDCGLYLFHCARRLLEAGSGPYFYLPELESHLEARLWNDVFLFAQERLSIPRGTIRATVLVETITAAFAMDEILYELREHSAGLNAGHATLGRSFTELLVKTCHRRGAHAIGGMAAVFPARPDALERVQEDKLREARDGFDGTWVAHPDLVPAALSVFDDALGELPNQIDRLREDVFDRRGGMMAPTNLAENLRASARRDPAGTALKLDEFVLTYAALDDASARAATLLREHGVREGDRVGLMLPNVPHFAIAYFGALRAGAAVVPMNVLFKRRELAFALADSEAKVLLAWRGVAEEAQPGAAQSGTECVIVAPGEFERLLAGVAPAAEIAGRGPSDTAVILYTSGTTGTPKGAELTHANLGRNAAIAAWRLFGLDAHSVILGSLPLFHSFGQTCALNAAVLAGASVTLLPRFDPGRALEIIERDGVTIFMGVPTMYNALLNHPERDRFDVSSLQLCVSGGASLPVELLHGFEQAFSCTILEGYGLSETSPVAAFNHPDRERKPGSIGTPIDGVEMKLLDATGGELANGEVGEIVIRGHNVMKGYWRKPEATAEAISADGWFRSGDLGRMDEDGYFFIVDRKKDMIIRGGYNVYPREIEELLYSHPAVREAAVVGVPHAELGEEVAAAVALKPDARATEEELREFVKEQVAAYKYPRVVWFVDELPKTATGKILKRELQP